VAELENKNTRASSSSINESSFYYEECGKALRGLLAASEGNEKYADDKFIATQCSSSDRLSEDLLNQMVLINGTLFKEEADTSLRSLMSLVYDSKENDDHDDGNDNDNDDDGDDYEDDDDDDDDEDDDDDDYDNKDDDDDYYNDDEDYYNNDDYYYAEKVQHAWNTIDLYRLAIVQTKGKNLELEAEALSQIGYIYEQVLGDDAKAKVCFYSCFNICESMRPKQGCIIAMITIRIT
jgi:hypothetical protein